MVKCSRPKLGRWTQQKDEAPTILREELLAKPTAYHAVVRECAIAVLVDGRRLDAQRSHVLEVLVSDHQVTLAYRRAEVQHAGGRGGYR